MRIAKKQVRTPFSRPWVPALLTSLVSATVLLGASVVITGQQARQNESLQWNAEAARFLVRLYPVSGQLQVALVQIEQQPFAGISGHSAPHLLTGGPIIQGPALGITTAASERQDSTPARLAYRMPVQNRDYHLVLIAQQNVRSETARGPGWPLMLSSLLISMLTGALVFQCLRRSQSLGAELAGALRRREIKVLYQPIFDLETRLCVGAEALVRWRRQDGTLTSPDLFIPMAENTGQIRQITDFVLEQLLEQLGPLLRSNPQLYVSVNLAACDVMSARIGRVAARLLALHKVAARQVAFEVTERGLIDAATARTHLQRLRNRGHRILIDDFGTGYCSLAYLQTLPVDCLKIDKAFVSALGHDAASSGVAPHIIRMAHALRLKVIAEGIEFESQAVLLRSEGVSHGQGWLLSRPLTAARFSELITGGRRHIIRRKDDVA